MKSGKQSVQSYENLFGLNGSTLLNVDGSNGSVLRSGDVVFHLHCLENAENVTLLNCLTGGYVYLHDSAGHRSLNCNCACIRCRSCLGSCYGSRLGSCGSCYGSCLSANLFYYAHHFMAYGNAWNDTRYASVLYMKVA